MPHTNTIIGMKLTLQLQRLPDSAQADALRTTVERFNEAATWLADVAFRERCANKIALQKLTYSELRERFGLPADTAMCCIAQVVEAYKRDKTVCPTFRAHAAVPFSMGKSIGFKSPDRVRIATLDGRIILPYLMGAYQEERFGFAHGQADRVLRRDGKWFLLVTVDVPDGTPLPITDCIGVDLGVVTMATTSDAETHTGETVEICRTRYARRRQRLQRAAHLSHLHGKRPKNIRRALQRTSRREAAFRRDVNHGISQRLVASATDTNNADYNGALNIRYRALVSAPEVAGAAFQPRQRLAGGTPATSCLL